MKHLYGEFTENQISQTALKMHNDIHKLLRYKDIKVTEKDFLSDSDFDVFFVNTLIRFSGLNNLLLEPVDMVSLLSVLQSALTESRKKDFNFGSKGYARCAADAGFWQ